jgi:Tol biopolymer transport system component
MCETYVMRPDGQGLTRLTVGAGVTKDLSRWSPDGSRIAFQIARGEKYDIPSLNPEWRIRQ